MSRGTMELLNMSKKGGQLFDADKSEAYRGSTLEATKRHQRFEPVHGTNPDSPHDPNNVDWLGSLHHEVNKSAVIPGCIRYRSDDEYQQLLGKFLQPIPVEGHLWSGTVSVLNGVDNRFHSRCLVLTASALYFASARDKRQCCWELIPLREIRVVRIRPAKITEGVALKSFAHMVSGDASVVNISGTMPKETSFGNSFDARAILELGQGEHTESVLEVATSELGFNGGRMYSIRAGSLRILEDIKEHINLARSRSLNRTHHLYPLIFCRHLYRTKTFHYFRAGMIVTSFIACIIEAQIKPEVGTESYQFFNSLELFFVVWFTVELCFHILVSCPWFGFFTSAYNLFELFLVLISFVSAVYSARMTSHDVPSFRAVRVLRVFRVLRAMRLVMISQHFRTILIAVYRSLNSVFHAFVLCFVVMSVYTIIGASLFDDVARFDNFSEALMTMAILASLENWDSILEEIKSTSAWGGETSFGGNILIHVFVMSYIMIMAYCLLNIVVAVLLQNFWECQHEQERAHHLETLVQVGRPLDALLYELVSMPFSTRERDHQIALLFQAFDVLRNERLNYFELAHGLASLKFEPKIHLSYDDFVQLTRELDKRDGEMTISAQQFCDIMLDELHNYVMRRDKHGRQTEGEESSLSLAMQQHVEILHKEIQGMNARLLGMEAKHEMVLNQRLEDLKSMIVAAAVPSLARTSTHPSQTKNDVQSHAHGLFTVPTNGHSHADSAQHSQRPTSPRIHELTTLSLPVTSEWNNHDRPRQNHRFLHSLAFERDRRPQPLTASPGPAVAQFAHADMFGVRSDNSVGSVSMDGRTNAHDGVNVGPSFGHSVLAGGGRYFDLETPTVLLEAEMYPSPKKKYEQNLLGLHAPSPQAGQNGSTLAHARSNVSHT